MALFAPPPPKGPPKVSSPGVAQHTDIPLIGRVLPTEGNRQHGAFRGEKGVTKVILPLVNVKMNTTCLRPLSLTELSSDHDVARLLNSKQEPQLMKCPKPTSCCH